MIDRYRTIFYPGLAEIDGHCIYKNQYGKKGCFTMIHEKFWSKERFPIVYKNDEAQAIMVDMYRVKQRV